MAETWQKEQISRAFVHANVASAQEGMTIGDWDVDKDGVDVTIRKGGLMVDIQLKCTQALPRVGDHHTFDLDIPTYNKLRVVERCAPGYLVVIVVPPDIDKWLSHELEHTVMRCVGFYGCIQGSPEVSNQATISIKMPITNRFDRDALAMMMEHSRHKTLGLPWGLMA
ncbi:DUF4365 domain-containing protein [Catellatospora bangladeshensis]|uniref:DUF4365 domain-containing protein n=1 Tax=Catellatospora bangladeshensis TaxID=310355 RepID=A0A8J3JWW9_9ACTN|nr:DUF4365 domain-containing protein [Catellatospora bangladeshensis]GIF86523.1 hypothetical protein Cba03nite_78720 [Catellatospora bangladeshensis]